MELDEQLMQFFRLKELYAKNVSFYLFLHFYFNILFSILCFCLVKFSTILFVIHAFYVLCCNHNKPFLCSKFYITKCLCMCVSGYIFRIIGILSTCFFFVMFSISYNIFYSNFNLYVYVVRCIIVCRLQPHTEHGVN